MWDIYREDILWERFFCQLCIEGDQLTQDPLWCIFFLSWLCQYIKMSRCGRTCLLYSRYLVLLCLLHKCVFVAWVCVCRIKCVCVCVCLDTPRARLAGALWDSYMHRCHVRQMHHVNTCVQTHVRETRPYMNYSALQSYKYSDVQAKVAYTCSQK